MKILHAFRCGDLPFCVGDALGQLRPGGEGLLELVVGDAHRQAKFLQMVLGRAFPSRLVLLHNAQCGFSRLVILSVTRDARSYLIVFVLSLSVSTI